MRNSLPGRSRRDVDRSETEIDLAAMDLSPRGLLDGLVETFVAGLPRSHLVRPQGYGMDPPFQRMRAPHGAVVEMRTRDTRTFGFFVRKDVFIAMRLEYADETHANPNLYEKHAELVERLLRRMSCSDVDDATPVEALLGEALV